MEFTSYHSSSSGNLCSLRSGDNTLLLEAGVKVRAIRKALGFRLSDVDGCLISHDHMDHAKGTAELMAFGVDCYMTKETAGALKLGGHRLHIIEPLHQFHVGNRWTVLPFPTEHDAPGSVGFLVSDGHEKCLFITDSFYCRYSFKGVGIYAIECNYSKDTISPNLDPARKKRLPTSHFSLENVLKFLAANDLSKCREIHLLHLSDENSDEGMFKKVVQSATGIPVFVARK